MNIVKATKLYEDWLAASLSIVEGDLALKHNYMAEDVFSFMRATYYRWTQRWAEEDEFEPLNGAPPVLSVGDLHTDNFGSWRDQEARLVWGVNDFDEACLLPYTADLVRLTTSAWLALDDGFHSLSTEDIASHVLAGYVSGLKQGGGPIVLAEESEWLQTLITPNFKTASTFWEKLVLPDAQAPEPAVAAIEKFLPESKNPYRISKRTAGTGSLGRQRYVAIMTFGGAYAAREAKPLLNSAATLEWRDGERQPPYFWYNEMLDVAVRSPDPYLREYHGWVVRRLSPEYVRVDLASLETDKLVGQVLNAMGWETANIHLGSHRAAKDIRKDLKQREKNWLGDAAGQMLDFLFEDFADWKRHWLEIQSRSDDEAP